MVKIERLWLSTITLYYSKKCKILYLTIVKTTASIRKIKKTAYKTLKLFFYSPNSSQVICSQTLIFKPVPSFYCVISAGPTVKFSKNFGNFHFF